MVRLRLSYADLARVRFTTQLNPFSETMISAQTLLAPDRPAAFAALRARHDPTAAQARLLRHLIPVAGSIPDFLTPAGPAASIEEAIDAVRSTAAATIAGDVAGAYRAVAPTPLRRSLAAADLDTVDGLVRSARWYFDRILAPAWPTLERVVRADVAGRGRTMASTGIDAVLDTLHPHIRWEPPVLSVDTGAGASADGAVDLGGRGLLLAPWPLAGRRPRLLVADDQPAFVMYPITVPDIPADPDGCALDTLMGRTRANVLRLLASTEWYTTSELAVRLGVSAASASAHATALRAAGLIGTARAGRAVRHRITRLGSDLIGAVSY